MGVRLGIYAEVASGTENGTYLSYFSHFFSKMRKDIAIKNGITSGNAYKLIHL